jgi:hypothetical protein
VESALVPKTDQWIKKVWHVYTMEYYSAIMKYEIMLFAGKWMELEIITLTEISQAQKPEHCMFSLICEI